jgi:hypothetical protein
MGIGYILGIKKKEWSYTSTPLLGLHVSPREFTVLLLLSLLLLLLILIILHRIAT